MKLIPKLLVAAASATALAGLSSAASAQPIPIVVNALSVPVAIVQAPFEFLDAELTPPGPGAYNPAPAEAAAVAYTDEGYGVVRTPVLKQTGPRFANPPGRYRRAVVLRRGAVVPDYVTTAPMENVSVAGLAPGGDYEFFVAPSGRTVVLDPATRQVVRILR